MDRRWFLKGLSALGALATTPVKAAMTLLGAGSGASGAPFSPLTGITGLIGWWDTSVTASITLSGSNVTALADQSGRGNNLGNGGLGRTLPYSATAFNTIYPGMKTTGGNGFLETSGVFTDMGTGNTLTAWYVGTMCSGGSSSYGRVMSYTHEGQNDYQNVGSWSISMNNGSTTSLEFIRLSPNVLHPTATPSPAGHRIIMTINSSGLTSVYVDGVVSGGTMTIGGNWNNTTAAFDLFRHAQHDTEFGYCTISEAGLATGYSDAATVALLDTYLANKWGLDPVGQFLARATSLDATHTSAYTTLINGLVTDGVWPKIDVLYVFATNSAANAVLNLVSSSFTGTPIGSPTFVADRGYTGVDGSSTVWINPGFNAIAQAATCKYKQNDAHLAVWSNTAAAASSGNGVMIGNIVGGTTNYSFIAPRQTGNTGWYVCNSNGSDIGTIANTDGSGHYIVSRVSSTTQVSYRNGVSLATQTITSNPPVNQVMGILALEDASTGPKQGSGSQCAAISIGGGLDATQSANFYARLRTYMTAVGVP